MQRAQDKDFPFSKCLVFDRFKRNERGNISAVMDTSLEKTFILMVPCVKIVVPQEFVFFRINLYK